MTAPMLATGAVENVTNPGTGTFTLLGPVSGIRRRFRDDGRVASGTQVYYTATDGTQTEWGVGTLSVGTNGSYDTLTRDTIIETTGGTNGKLNFTGNLQVFSATSSWSHPMKDVLGGCWAGVTSTDRIKTESAVSMLGVAFGNGGTVQKIGVGSAGQTVGGFSFTAAAVNAQIITRGFAQFDTANYTPSNGEGFGLALTCALFASGSTTAFTASSDRAQITTATGGKLITTTVATGLVAGGTYNVLMTATLDSTANNNVKALLGYFNGSLVCV